MIYQLQVAISFSISYYTNFPPLLISLILTPMR